MVLCYIGIQVPNSVKKIIDNSAFSVNEENALTFIKFTLPEEIEFFKSLDWIFDYNQVQNLSKEEIENIIRNLLREIISLDDNKNINKENLAKFMILKHKMTSLSFLLEIKQEKKIMALPTFKNSNNPKEDMNIIRKKVVNIASKN